MAPCVCQTLNKGLWKVLHESCINIIYLQKNLEIKNKKKKDSQGTKAGRFFSAHRHTVVEFASGKIEMNWTFAKQLQVQLRCGVTSSCFDQQKKKNKHCRHCENKSFCKFLFVLPQC